MPETTKFCEVCEGAGDMLKLLAQQAVTCGEPVEFVKDRFQPCLKAIADELFEFSRVKLVDK